MNDDKAIKPICGIVMPISAIDGCSEGHWLEVKSILIEAISDAGFDSNIVSDGDDIGVIQSRIVHHLYSYPMVVCDVSAKNANVMFELGIRLTFDKPTIVVKDDQTGYSFDTSPIEHVPYPRDLRFQKIVDFKKRLSEKIRAITAEAEKDTGYSSFLKHFGPFKVPKIGERQVPELELVLDEMKGLRQEVVSMRQNLNRLGIPVPRPRRELTESGVVEYTIRLKPSSMENIDVFIDYVRAYGPGLRGTVVSPLIDGNVDLHLKSSGPISQGIINDAIKASGVQTQEPFEP